MVRPGTHEGHEDEGDETLGADVAREGDEACHEDVAGHEGDEVCHEVEIEHLVKAPVVLAPATMRSSDDQVMNGAPFFLSLYGGVSRVARAAHSDNLGSLVFDIEHHSCNNLGSPKAEKDLMWLVNRRLLGGESACRLSGIELPCNSWSLARRGRPPPLRDSSTLLMGLPDLSSKDKLRVQHGNRQCWSAVRLIQHALKRNIPGYLENPKTSRLWKTRGIQQLPKHNEVQLLSFDQCQ